MANTKKTINADILDRLADTIALRAIELPDKSWTARLLGKGVNICARKLGEEALETVIAACEKDKQALISESADLLYHWLVLLKASDVSPHDVYDELSRREGRSGIDEKASRSR